VVDDAPVPPRAHVGTDAELRAAVAALGVPSPRPVLVCVGGADGMADDDAARVADLVARRVVPVLVRHHAVVVDGGTDAGVMRVLGRVRHERGQPFALLGVAARGTVTGATRLEPHHTGVLLVPGDAWGDETPWLSRAAAVVAAGSPSVTLLLNGGDVALGDVEQSVADGRPVLVVAGTGRTADAIAVVGTGDDASPGRIAAVAASGLVTVVPSDDPDGLTRALDDALSGRTA
jgi:hypothetical protein